MGSQVRRDRVAEIWGMPESELDAIRQATRDAVTSGLSDQGETLQSVQKDEDKRQVLFRTDGGNLLIN